MTSRHWPARVTRPRRSRPAAGRTAHGRGAGRGSATPAQRRSNATRLAARTLIEKSAASGFAGVHDHVGALLDRRRRRDPRRGHQHRQLPPRRGQPAPVVVPGPPRGARAAPEVDRPVHADPVPAVHALPLPRDGAGHPRSASTRRTRAVRDGSASGSPSRSARGTDRRPGFRRRRGRTPPARPSGARSGTAAKGRLVPDRSRPGRASHPPPPRGLRRARPRNETAVATYLARWIRDAERIA